jgi:prepilin-type N-terminal cleavage/methylation domain-containing protein
MKRQDGFTLIEILVAFVIMSMTVLAGLQLFSSGVARVTRINDTRHSMELARTLIESGETSGSLPSGWRIVVGPPLDTSASWTTLAPRLVQVVETQNGVDHVVLETIELRQRQ